MVGWAFSLAMAGNFPALVMGIWWKRATSAGAVTEAGARLFPAIRGGLEAVAVAIAVVKQDGNQRPLRVTTTNAFASRWLVPRLPMWRKVHPNVPLDVIGTDSVLDLQAGDGDVAIRYATGRAAPTDGMVDSLLSDTFWPFCNPRLLPPGPLMRPVDLAKHVLVHSYSSPADCEPPTWQRWLAAAERRWRNVGRFGSTHGSRAEFADGRAATTGNGNRGPRGSCRALVDRRDGFWL